jgi:hypothetical protein
MNYPLYRDTLCPKLWVAESGQIKLNREVRKSLLKIAQDFIKELKLNNEIEIKATDVVIIGSITNYNWTQYSDIDLHIVADYSTLNMSKEDAQTLFDAIKRPWNETHNITMKGHDVELYVQDVEYTPTSASEYSVLSDKWLIPPVKEKPNFNVGLIKKKYKEYKNKINSLISSNDEAGLKSLLDKLYKFRQAGLDSSGELSEENIVFKMLRAKGFLDKIKDSAIRLYDKSASVKEITGKKCAYKSP